MRTSSPSHIAMLVGVFAAAWTLSVTARTTQEVLPLGPPRERGASVTPAFEGWYANADGSFSLLVGYFNRNAKQTFDIAIGPDNRIEPGNPDQGQPTHFEVGRQWGVFVLKVPKDFGKQALTWTITANGEPQSIPLTLNPGYPITPFKELGMGNQPPVLAFTQGGAKVTGPPVAVAAAFTGQTNQPLPLSVWVEDTKSADAEVSPRGRGAATVATVSFHKFRGPGAVTFERARVPVAKQGDIAATTATFATPGEYLLRVQANDESGEGGGGFQCCWTNTYVKVTVQ